MKRQTYMLIWRWFSKFTICSQIMAESLMECMEVNQLEEKVQMKILQNDKVDSYNKLAGQLSHFFYAHSTLMSAKQVFWVCLWLIAVKLLWTQTYTQTVTPQMGRLGKVQIILNNFKPTERPFETDWVNFFVKCPWDHHAYSPGGHHTICMTVPRFWKIMTCSAVQLVH